MYVLRSAHAEKTIGIPDKEHLDLIWEFISQATRPKYSYGSNWEGPGDLVM